jgi:hypothetical protein
MRFDVDTRPPAHHRELVEEPGHVSAERLQFMPRTVGVSWLEASIGGPDGSCCRPGTSASVTAPLGGAREE